MPNCPLSLSYLVLLYTDFSSFCSCGLNFRVVFLLQLSCILTGLLKAIILANIPDMHRDTMELSHGRRQIVEPMQMAGGAGAPPLT